MVVVVVEAQVQPLGAQVQDNYLAPNLHSHPFSLATIRCHPSPPTPPRHPFARSFLLLVLRKQILHGIWVLRVLLVGVGVERHVVEALVVAVQYLSRRGSV